MVCTTLMRINSKWNNDDEDAYGAAAAANDGGDDDDDGGGDNNDVSIDYCSHSSGLLLSNQQQGLCWCCLCYFCRWWTNSVSA